jgi:hypothetical protein
MPNLLKKRAVFGIVAESTFGTFVNPIGSQCFPVFDLQVTLNGDNYQRQETRDFFGQYDDVAGTPKTMEVALKFLLVGSGTAGTAAHYDALLKACGMQSVVTGGVSVVYKPISTFDATSGRPARSYSAVVAYPDAYLGSGSNTVQFAMKGAVGTVKFVGDYKSPMVAEVKLMGAYQSVTDVAALVPSGVSTQSPPLFVGGAFQSIGGYAAEISSVTYDMNQTMVEVMDVNNTNGIVGYAITGRDPVGDFDPALPRIAVQDLFTKWQAGTTGSIGMTAAVGAAGNQIKMNATRCQYRKPGIADRGGFLTGKFPFGISVSTAGVDGDDFTLTLT